MLQVGSISVKHYSNNYKLPKVSLPMSPVVAVTVDRVSWGISDWLQFVLTNAADLQFWIEVFLCVITNVSASDWESCI